MSITVKRLIAELEKIDNKLLEVEVLFIDRDSLEPEIESVWKSGFKVYIRCKRTKDK